MLSADGFKPCGGQYISRADELNMLQLAHFPHLVATVNEKNFVIFVPFPTTASLLKTDSPPSNGDSSYVPLCLTVQFKHFHTLECLEMVDIMWPET